jgi:hypothetical protein
MYNDSLNAPANDPKYAALHKFRSLTPEQSYTDKDLTKVLDNISKDTYTQKVCVPPAPSH